MKATFEEKAIKAKKLRQKLGLIRSWALIGPSILDQTKMDNEEGGMTHEESLDSQIQDMTDILTDINNQTTTL